VIPVLLPGSDPSAVNDFVELNSWVDLRLGLDDEDAMQRLVRATQGLRPGRPQKKVKGNHPIFTVPLPENPFFTERAHELADLQSALEKTGSYALTGLGGVGKTQTAAEYAHRRREKYNTVIWLRAEKEDTLFADLTALAHLLKLTEAEAKDQ